MSNTVFDKNQKRNYFLLFCLLFVTCIIVYSSFIGGENYYLFLDANDDTFQSYLPVYQLMVNKIRTGNWSLMDLCTGLGTNILSMQMVIFDPFAFFLYIIGGLLGPGAVPGALIWVQILKVICAGMACMLFLSQFHLKEFSIIIGSWAYAFSAFMVGGIGQHYMFATAPVFMVLVLWLVEKSTKKKAALPWLALCICMVGIWSIYFCYMILLAAGLYTVLRFFQSGEKLTSEKAVAWFIPLLISVIIGVLMAGTILVPVAYQMLLVSARISDAAKSGLADMLRPHSLKMLKTTFLRLFSEHAEGTMNQWTGANTHFNSPHLYCSPLLIACVPQYLATLWHSHKGRKRTVTGVACVVIILSFFVPAAGLIFNVFIEYMARYVFVLLPAFAYIIASTLTHATKNQEFSLKAADCTFSIVCLAILLTNWNGRIRQSAVLLLGYVVILLGVGWIYVLAKPINKFRKIVHGSFVLLLGLSICAETITGLLLNRNIVTASAYQSGNHDKRSDLIAEINVQNSIDFFRIENNVNGWAMHSAYNDAMVQGFRGISYYNSVINSNLLSYRENFGDGDRSIAGYYSINSLGRAMDSTVADLFGIRYVFTNYKTQEQGWELIRSYGEDKYGKTDLGYLYQNKNINTAGLLFYSWYPEAELDTMEDLKRQAILPFAVSLDQAADSVEQKKPDPLKLVDAIQQIQTDDRSSQVAPGVYLLQSSETLGEGLCLKLDSEKLQQPDRRIWLCFDVCADADAQLTTAIDIGNGYNMFFWANNTAILDTAQKQTVRVALPTDTKQISLFLQGMAQAQISNIQVWGTDGKNYSNTGVTLKNYSMGGTIEGTVETGQPAILLIPIFYEEGWTAQLNGQPTKILKADKGLCAIELPVGSHTVELRYDAPGLKAGIIFCMVGMLGWMGLWRWAQKRGS